MHFSCLITVTGLSDLYHTSIFIGTQVILLSYNIFISIASMIVYLTSVHRKEDSNIYCVFEYEPKSRPRIEF